MKLFATAALAVALVALAPSAIAQNESTVGLLASGAEVVGQDLGQAAVGGQSVFVYASGRARLATPPAPTAGYSIELSTSAPTAVGAASQRTAELGRMRAVAQTFGVTMDVTDSRMSLGETEAMAAMNRIRLQRPGVMPSGQNSGAPDAKPPFIAVATVRFSRPSEEKEAPLLDALHEAGADNINVDNLSANGMVFPTNMFTQGEAINNVDPKTWDAATRDAVRAARDQATVLADAAGRSLGEARQVLQLTRSIEGGNAVVVVAMRFAFAPGK